MKVNFELEEKEQGLAIEYATAIINSFMGNIDCDDSERREHQLDMLEEIADHITTYVAFNS